MDITYLISYLTAVLLIFVIIIQRKNQMILREFISSSSPNTQYIKKQPTLDKFMIPKAKSHEYVYRYSEIQKISYKHDNNGIVFTKTLLPSIDLTNYTPLGVTSSIMTATIAQFSPLAIQNATYGIFEATVNPSLLTSFQNGLTSTIVQNTNGRIIQHAGFTSSAPQLLAPLLLFQITSFVTGQYYFNIIQGNLNNTIRQIDDLKRFAKHNKLAELENIQLHIQKLSQIQHPQLEHLILAHQLETEITKLIRYYVNEVKHFTTPLKRNISLFTSKQLDSLKKHLYNDDFGFQIQMLASAEEMQQTIRMVSLYLNCHYTNHEDAHKRNLHIGEIINQILQWDATKTFINQEGKQIISKYYNEILRLANAPEPYLQKGKEKQKKFINDLIILKNNILSVGKFQSSIEFQKKLKCLWNKKHHILLTINVQEQPVLWIKKDEMRIN